MRAFVFAAFLLSCSKTQEAPPPPRKSALVEFEPKGKLFKVHYPDDYAGRKAGENSVVVFGTGMGGTSKSTVASFIGIEKPITDDIPELARVLVKSISEDKSGWADVGRTPGKCNGEDGLRVESTYLDGAVLSRVIGCVFLKRGHGFFFYMDLPEARRGSDEPALRKIIDATEFAP